MDLLALLLMVLAWSADLQGVAGDKKGDGEVGSLLDLCICPLMLNISEKLWCRFEESGCPEALEPLRNLSRMPGFPSNQQNKTCSSLLGEGKKNGTYCCQIWDLKRGNASLNATTLLCEGKNSSNISVEKSKTPERASSFNTAVTVTSSFIGILAFILLSVGIMTLTLRKWRNERLFRRQMREQDNFLLKLKEPNSHSSAIYCNVINLDAWKEDDFATYANVLTFQPSKRPSPATCRRPEQVEYASIVFR
ncbi:uncharacterized protein LOC119930951 [Tachyglossus aculeatus]|uniref:uncharacterized protein LOC119930951 n=1 Tax=Tachyglossus aculeatus TaxID=9261 RepID=UPI0018F77041|nr:uncharacterized protein LOC119930951 [Tachyglossus aculeatus]